MLEEGYLTGQLAYFHGAAVEIRPVALTRPVLAYFDNTY